MVNLHLPVFSELPWSRRCHVPSRVRAHCNAKRTKRHNKNQTKKFCVKKKSFNNHEIETKATKYYGLNENTKRSSHGKVGGQDSLVG
jgi:hypothetical protein